MGDDTLLAALVEVVFGEFCDRQGMELYELDDDTQEDIRACLTAGFREELGKAAVRHRATEQESPSGAVYAPESRDMGEDAE